MPASCNGPVKREGSPAEVVTNETPRLATKATMSSSATNIWAMLTPQGLSVRSRMASIASRTWSRRPEDVSTIPMAPALDTADASGARAMYPIGAWTMG